MENKIDTTTGTSPKEGEPQSRLLGRLRVREGWFWPSVIVLVLISFYILLQIARTLWVPPNIALSYVALVLVPLFLAISLGSFYLSRVDKRRKVDDSEVENLYSEIAQYSHSLENDPVRTEVSKLAEAERIKLDAIDRPILELDVLPLRKLLVDLYHPPDELGAKASRELAILDEYQLNYAEPQRKLVRRIEELLKKSSEDRCSRQRTKDNQDDDNKTSKKDASHITTTEELRAELKSLRETVAYYDKTYALGESLRTCATAFLSVSVIATFLIGILPLVHVQGNGNIMILHWVSLGASGSFLAAILQIHRLDLPELGETQGSQLLSGLIKNVATGPLSAALLYGALSGGILAGEVFPFLPTAEAENQAVSVGLSLFWATMAGFTPTVLRRLSQLAESSLGEERFDPDDE